MPKTYRLSELTATEIKAAAQRKPVLLLPMGSFEDQGPHAPVGDYLSADRVAELIAQRATEGGTETYVLPVVPFGGNDFFGYMPGCISLTQSTLRKLVDDMLSCLLRHGLTRIVIVNGHGGNCSAIHEATQKIWNERRVLIPSYYLWKTGYQVLPEILGAERAALSSGHGSNPLTSVTMHLFPELIREDLIGPPSSLESIWGLPIKGFDTLAIGEGSITVPLEGDDTVPNGILGGDPRLCTAETGAALVEKLVSVGAEVAKHVARRSDSKTGQAQL
ncbi:creatininase family protein [Paraburkholderia sp. BL25I1N1]|uniref:creatininase family protein n=1 Tax=Paraburkholderia sp. BL25I1N1 TaxID=1938804 RepID=UPI000D40A7EE|nr:creatininase family protein [Paraburkholderia sp. BL25I1N1]PRX96465.1 creatinine amidohydrolase [Paraburkholderia sp. BL25I1N1]